jgi:hypothetical protein
MMKYKISMLSIAMAAIVLVSIVAATGVSAAKPAVVGTVGAGGASTVGGPITGAPAVCWDGATYWTVAQGVADVHGNTIYWATGTQATPWNPIGTGTNPTVVAIGAGNVVILARGADGTIWAKETTNYGVSWTNVALPTLAVKAGTGPTAVFLAATPELDVFYVATNGNLMVATLNLGTASTSLQNLGGNVFATPAAAATSTSSMDVVVKGTGGGIYQIPYAMGGFGSWSAKFHDGTIGAGASLASAVASVPDGDVGAPVAGNLFLLVSGTNSRLYEAWSTDGGTTWVTNYQQKLVPLNTHALYWANLGGVVTSAPSTLTRIPGLGETLVRGGDGRIWVNDEAIPVAGNVPAFLITGTWIGSLGGP